MPRSQTTLSSRAYLKLILHAAKYQTRAVLGLLIADAPTASAAADGASLHIKDILPLFHSAPLAPTIELALSQAEVWMRAQPNGAQSILAGVYYSPELYATRMNSLGEATLPQPYATVCQKICDKMHVNGGGGAVAAGSRIVLLDNEALGKIGAPSSESTHSALEVFERSASSSSSAGGNPKWTHAGSATLADGSSSSSSGKSSADALLVECISQLRSLLKSERQRGLCDLEDHLDDARADWTNVNLEKDVLPTSSGSK